MMYKTSMLYHGKNKLHNNETMMYKTSMLYHGKNKLHNNETMIYKTSMLSWIFIVLAH
jgi:hypothetical protein